MTANYLTSTIGGLCIGLSATAFLLLNGRIAGITGIVDGIFQSPSHRSAANLLFVCGLIAGPVAFHLVFDRWPTVRISGSIAVYACAGLLVGFGTRLGGGCTSGHGVCGLARLSPRSFVAVATFLATGVVTVFAMRILS